MSSALKNALSGKLRIIKIKVPNSTVSHRCGPQGELVKNTVPDPAQTTRVRISVTALDFAF